MKKMLILLILVVALAVAGCAEDNTPSNGVAESDSEQVKTVESSDGVQQVEVISPVTFHDDDELYWQWHKETHDILTTKIGQDVKLYAYSVQYRGELKEVTDFYAVLEDDVAGEIYIDIGSLNAIAGETTNVHD
jgi:hypothetical protein